MRIFKMLKKQVGVLRVGALGVASAAMMVVAASSSRAVRANGAVEQQVIAATTEMALGVAQDDFLGAHARMGVLGAPYQKFAIAYYESGRVLFIHFIAPPDDGGGGAYYQVSLDTFRVIHSSFER